MKKTWNPSLLISVASWLCLAPWAQAQIYRRIDLLSDGGVPASHVDTKLVNPWGLASAPTGPFWIANNGTGTASLVLDDGAPTPPAITVPDGRIHPLTGIAYNDTGGFVIDTAERSGPSVLLFATEGGTILGWRPDLDPDPPVLVVDNSDRGSVYKGLALAINGSREYLYATDFFHRKVDVFDADFAFVGFFTDVDVPQEYAPFGIARIGGVLVVTFAERNASGQDDVPGAGHGFVDVFAPDGRLLKRLVSRGPLDSPWGLALAPAEFGEFGRALLVGNFGDGRIHAFNPETGAERGTLKGEDGNPIHVDGLWGLSFAGGFSDVHDDRRVYFTAGIDGERHGVFGAIERVP